MKEVSDIIKDNDNIRKLIKEYMDVNELTLMSVQEAGKDEGISVSNLSRYLNNYKGSRATLTQTQILWLCNKFGIDVTLTVQLKKKNGKRKLQRATAS